MKILLSHTKTKIVQADYQAQKTIDLSWQNVRRVVVVGGQNIWEQENIFLPPKQPRGQPRGNRQGDCLTYRRWCHSQSYDILLTQKFSSWFPGIIQVFAKQPFLSAVQARTIEPLSQLLVKQKTLAVFRKEESYMLESFHGSWNHQWSFWAWRCGCDSQSSDNAFNHEICMSAESSQGKHVFWDRAEMVAF